MKALLFTAADRCALLAHLDGTGHQWTYTGAALAYRDDSRIWWDVAWDCLDCGTRRLVALGSDGTYFGYQDVRR